MVVSIAPLELGVAFGSGLGRSVQCIINRSVGPIQEVSASLSLEIVWSVV
jgi:hypothetical protein